MEPESISVDPGPNALLTSDTIEVLKSKIEWNVGLEKTNFNHFKPWMLPEKNLDLYVSKFFLIGEFIDVLF